LTSVGTLTSLTVSGALTVDTNTLVVDAANNRVGVLNATPGSTLHVGSTVASGGLADSTFRLNVSSASNTFFAVQDATVQCYFGAVGTFATPEMRIGTYTNHPLRMIVNNSQLWSFLSGGSFVCTAASGNARIGIGNALPDYSLHIGTTAPPAALGQVMVTGTASNVGVSVTNGTVQGYLLTDLGGSLLFGSFSSHDLVVRTNNTNRWSVGASTGHFLAGPDNTYDIGASGASRPRDLFVARNLNVDGGTLAVDATNNRVGVGTATPAVDFDVSRNTTSVVSLQVTNTANANQYVYFGMGGSSAFGVPGWDNSGILEAVTIGPASGTRGLVIGVYGSGPIIFQQSSRNERWRIDTTGHFLAGVDNTFDIGASGATRPRDLYLGRNMVGAGWVRAGAASAGAASTTTFGSTTSTTVGATGAASALPANPLGYLVAHVGTTEVRIPYYNA
jgi:hypothetical protein